MNDHRSEETKEPTAPLSLSFRIPKYFVQHPQLGFAVMVLTMLAGIVSYAHMPKHKDPHVEARTISATVSWPGAGGAGRRAGDAATPKSGWPRETASSGWSRRRRRWRHGLGHGS